MAHPRNVIQGSALRQDISNCYWLYSLKYGVADRTGPKYDGNPWGLTFAVAKKMRLSRAARKRLMWFYDYANRFDGNARLTCRHYGISPKTFYRWKKRFDITRLYALEDGSHRPKHGPLPVLNPEQTQRIVVLRLAHPFYSKLKIANLYERQWKTKLSSWQVQKVIQRFELYPDKRRAEKIARKRRCAFQKKRITQLLKEPKPGYLVSVDTVVIHSAGLTRYILTALDRYSRVAYARAYSSHSSRAAADFLDRLQAFMQGKIKNIQTDNGCEFQMYFEDALRSHGVSHYWSRVRTPKDNAQLERFNRTLQEEFPSIRRISDVNLLNDALQQWLVEYNYARPHAALGYKTPMEVYIAASQASVLGLSNGDTTLAARKGSSLQTGNDKAPATLEKPRR